MKKTLFVILFILCNVIVLKAQDYKTSLGLRLGLTPGITLKYFVSENTAFEGILGTRWEGTKLTGLFEIHNNIDDSPLVWYYGGGAHFGIYQGYKDNPWFYDDTETHAVLGIDGIIGLEYTFIKVPINVSVDWKPVINLIGHSGFLGDGGAISVRYVF